MRGAKWLADCRLMLYGSKYSCAPPRQSWEEGTRYFGVIKRIMEVDTPAYGHMLMVQAAWYPAVNINRLGVGGLDPDMKVPMMEARFLRGTGPRDELDAAGPWWKAADILAVPVVVAPHPTNANAVVALSRSSDFFR